MNSIDSLVKSETQKRNSKFFLVREDNLKRLFVEPFKMALFRATTKTKVFVFVCFDSFVIVLFMEIMLILRISTIIYISTIYSVWLLYIYIYGPLYKYLYVDCDCGLLLLFASCCICTCWLIMLILNIMP